MGTLVTIMGKEVMPLVFDGTPIMTAKMIDELHERAEGTARRLFRDNRDMFIEGEDFMKISAGVFRSRFSGAISDRATTDITAFTESGYLLITKGLTDKFSWQVQRTLVRCYFKVKEAAQALPEPKIVEVVPTVTVNAVEKAQQDAEFWRLKYELEQSKREVDQLKKQIGGDDRYYFTDADDEKLIRYKRQGLGATKIHRRHPEWKEDSISSRFRKLKKEGKL